jgi:hypothetical protein
MQWLIYLCLSLSSAAFAIANLYLHAQVRDLKEMIAEQKGYINQLRSENEELRSSAHIRRVFDI